LPDPNVAGLMNQAPTRIRNSYPLRVIASDSEAISWWMRLPRRSAPRNDFDRRLAKSRFKIKAGPRLTLPLFVVSDELRKGSEAILQNHNERFRIQFSPQVKNPSLPEFQPFLRSTAIFPNPERTARC